MNLRRATEADARQIARIHVLAWQETYHNILPDQFLASLSVERRQEMWTAQLADPTRASGIFVVEREGAGVVGFSSAGPARGEALGFSGELYAIYLLASHQRRGLGRALFCAAAGFLHQHGVRSMMLWVLKDNPTRGFYEHLGGTAYREQPIEIGSKEYLEVAYGWPDLTTVLRPEGGVVASPPI
ncbi:MAG: GNAT family N-acetyltransferase [Armatimonadota bacterium]|nr:GNAT family N-acetyltransferase [Armatimonadota bacterium]MDR7518259.1 GNAT family N-acetyltransferase [Armatimonadota bacterium]MDR7548683.1 GNAT family N-acetyltransferase [Armatimonadota bacterium]